MEFSKFLTLFFSFFVFILVSGETTNAQTNSNINLLYQDKIDTLPINYRDSYYSECWGFTRLNEDYAVISSTLGTHIYHITDAANSYQAAFIPNPVSGYDANWRDFHDYNGFLYVINDGPDGVLQIVDVRRLPNEVNVVYESDDFFAKAHNIFIDTATAKLYVCGGTTTTNQAIDLAIYDISNPQKPEFLNSYTDFGYIHDCFVRNDTAYLESPNQQALLIVNFKDVNNPETLGSLTNYPTAGYTHAGWLSEDGQYYVLSDETFSSTIKLLDVSEPNDIKVVTEFSAGAADCTMVHNPIILGNLVFVSYYNDGLQVFDITDPQNVKKAGFYDTYLGECNSGYRGAWGVYPFTDGKVIISDRQTGLYVFDASSLMDDYVNTPTFDQIELNIFPNPVKDELFIKGNNKAFNKYGIYSTDGKMRLQKDVDAFENNFTINTAKLKIGIYYLILQKNDDVILIEKILKQ